MNRLVVGLALLGSAYLNLAHAETQAELAAKQDEDGKAAMFAGNYKQATESFRSAADRAPEAKYYFHLCASLYQQGMFGQALTACNASDNLNPDPKTKEQITKTQELIKREAAAQHVPLAPTGGGAGPEGTDPNGGTNTMGSDAPGPNGGNPAGGGPVAAQPTYAIGRPTVNLLAVAKPEQTYTWTLGVDLFGGGGKVGQTNAFGSSAAGIRFKGDYMLNPAARFGLQGYIQLQHFGEGTAMNGGGASLDIFDLGIAAYKHFCGGKGFCLTPLAGAQLALMSPANQSDGAGSQVFNYAALGARLELAASYAFGTRYEHVLSLMVGLNAYSKVFSDPQDGMTAAEWGLDTGGVVGYGGVGYTYRFNTPLGSAPFISLD
ncbi:MAG: hypothetical protein ABI591_02965 [Kofleriaceae bacterium]